MNLRFSDHVRTEIHACDFDIPLSQMMAQCARSAGNVKYCGCWVAELTANIQHIVRPTAIVHMVHNKVIHLGEDRIGLNLFCSFSKHGGGVLCRNSR